MSSEEELYTMQVDKQIQQEMFDLKHESTVWVALMQHRLARIFRTEFGCDAWIAYQEKTHQLIYRKQEFKLYP